MAVGQSFKSQDFRSKMGEFLNDPSKLTGKIFEISYIGRFKEIKRVLVSSAEYVSGELWLFISPVIKCSGTYVEAFVFDVSSGNFFPKLKERKARPLILSGDIKLIL